MVEISVVHMSNRITLLKSLRGNLATHHFTRSDLSTVSNQYNYLCWHNKLFSLCPLTSDRTAESVLWCGWLRGTGRHHRGTPRIGSWPSAPTGLRQRWSRQTAEREQNRRAVVIHHHLLCLGWWRDQVTVGMWHMWTSTYRVVHMEQQTVFLSCEIDGAGRQSATFHLDLEPFGVILRPKWNTRLNTGQNQILEVCTSLRGNVSTLLWKIQPDRRMLTKKFQHGNLTWVVSVISNVTRLTFKHISRNKKMFEASHIQTLTVVFTDLFWLSLGPVVQPVLTYEHTFLCFVDQRVKWHKGHDAGQREAAGFNLHSDLNIKHSSVPNNIVYMNLGTKSVRVAASYQVIFVAAFTFDISVASNCIQRKFVRQFAVWDHETNLRSHCISLKALWWVIFNLAFILKYCHQ